LVQVWLFYILNTDLLITIILVQIAKVLIFGKRIKCVVLLVELLLLTIGLPLDLNCLVAAFPGDHRVGASLIQQS
jgi:hypothetical protein